jgi:hypothetical protein
MMKGLPMTDTIETYQPMPIATDDFLRLKAAVGDRDAKLQLYLEHTEDGAGYVLVTIKPVFRGGKESPIAIVAPCELTPNLTEGRRRPVRDGNNAKIGWVVYGPAPENGPEYEFAAIPEVANFLAFGDTQCCRRSVVKARRVGGEGPAAPVTKVRDEIVTDSEGLRALRRIEE